MEPISETSFMYAAVHVSETIRGGIASYLREIIPLQVARYGSGRVVVVTTDDQICDLGTMPGVKAISVKRATSRARTAWRVRCALTALLKDHPTRILHVHSTFAGVTCRLPFGVRRRVGAIVYCPHGWPFIRTGRTVRVAGWVERVLAHFCNAIVCVSKSEYAIAVKQGLSCEKLHVIYNGLPDRAPPVSAREVGHGALRLVFVGRFDRSKGFDVLVEALNLVKRPMEVEVFGESVLGEYQESRLPSSIHMRGWQGFSVIEESILRADALVMPSRWEALGISAIEAMRAAKPVVASRVGGLRELVEDGVTGFLIPSDSPQALATVLTHVKRSTLMEMGECGRVRFLKDFGIEQCEENLANLYDSVSDDAFYMIK